MDDQKIDELNRQIIGIENDLRMMEPVTLATRLVYKEGGEVHFDA